MMDMPFDRAPGLGSVLDMFFKICWEVIDEVIVSVIQCLHQVLNQRSQVIGSLHSGHGHAPLRQATDRGLLDDLGLRVRVPGASIFADEAVVLLKLAGADCNVICTLPPTC